MKSKKILFVLFGIISFQFIFSQNTVSYSPASTTISVNSGVEISVPITVSCSGTNSSMYTSVQPANTCSSTDGWVGLDFTNGLTAITPGNSTVIKFRFKKTVSSNTTVTYKFTNNGSCTSPQISITVNYIYVAPPPPNCNLSAPTGVILNQATTNSLTIKWNVIPGAVSYRLVYRKTGTTETFQPALTTVLISGGVCTQLITSLLPNTSYTWFVWGLCDANIITNQLSTSGTGSTLPCPTTLDTINDLTATQASYGYAINFTPIPNSTVTYTLEYFDFVTNSGGVVGSFNPSGTNSYPNFYYLDPNHSFKIRIIAHSDCTTSSSDWLTINPSCVLPSATNLLVNSVSGSGTFNWSLIPNALGYQGEYLIYNLIGQQTSGSFSITNNSYSAILNSSSISGTKYIKFRIKSKCFGGVWSDYSSWSTPNIWN